MEENNEIKEEVKNEEVKTEEIKEEKVENNNSSSEEVNLFGDLKDESKNYTQSEIENGRGLAIVSYLSILALIPFLTETKNKYVIYHSKIGMNLFILELIVSVICAAFPFLFVFFASLIYLLFVILSIVGIVNVCNGKAKELPIVNKIKIIK